MIKPFPGNSLVNESPVFLAFLQAEVLREGIINRPARSTHSLKAVPCHRIPQECPVLVKRIPEDSAILKLRTSSMI